MSVATKHIDFITAKKNILIIWNIIFSNSDCLRLAANQCFSSIYILYISLLEFQNNLSVAILPSKSDAGEIDFLQFIYNVMHILNTFTKSFIVDFFQRTASILGFSESTWLHVRVKQNCSCWRLLSHHQQYLAINAHAAKVFLKCAFMDSKWSVEESSHLLYTPVQRFMYTVNAAITSCHCLLWCRCLQESGDRL